MSLYVFADNDYQSFDKKRQKATRNCIRDLSLDVLGKEPHYAYLTAYTATRIRWCLLYNLPSRTAFRILTKLNVKMWRLVTG